MNTLQNGRLIQRIAVTSTNKLMVASNRLYATCPHAATVANDATDNTVHTTAAAAHSPTINGNQRIFDVTASFAPTMNEVAPRPYSEVPGPKPLPLLGNTWR